MNIPNPIKKAKMCFHEMSKLAKEWICMNLNPTNLILHCTIILQGIQLNQNRTDIFFQRKTDAQAFTFGCLGIEPLRLLFAFACHSIHFGCLGIELAYCGCRNMHFGCLGIELAYFLPSFFLHPDAAASIFQCHGILFSYPF